MVLVYDDIAAHFSATRYGRWPGVCAFLAKLAPDSCVGDVGTGNGKYMNYRSDLSIIGIDPCVPLLQIAKTRHFNDDFIRGDGRHLPFRTGTLDAAISIAVVHHLETHENRLAFLLELLRCVRVNGRILVTIWALQKHKPRWIHIGGGDFLIPWNDSREMRFYHLFSKEDVEKTILDLSRLAPLASATFTFERDNWYIEFFKGI